MTCNKSPVQLRPGGKPSLCGEDHQPLTWNIYYWYIRGLVPSLFGFGNSQVPETREKKEEEKSLDGEENGDTRASQRLTIKAKP